MSQDLSNFVADRQVAYDAYLEGRKAEAYQLLVQYLQLDQCHADFATVYKRSLPPREPKVGDILECNWGYDQTNIDYYKVVGVTKASVKLQKVRTQFVSSLGHTDVVTASDDVDGSVFTRRWKPGYESWKYGARISDGRGYAYLWDGVPSHQTAAGYGH